MATVPESLLPLRVSSEYSRRDLPKEGLPENQPLASAMAFRRLPRGVSGSSSLFTEDHGQ